ncbi:hypothetical protein A2Z33_03970 [Candidatus Gottesmanbacteria bacterium RBG_16_52_11]|uniref:NAD-dependent epimerase/dehydratase domain-containing protein n=1 Tax=Candidatus Gottesmanbacteria bacterium RBG_16_52_11 TaxID=1798374 RepID=A0A1F5YVR0_9BACT|nr:MAG: hypothetical protein A2Z33_03970 [Candidatus Gottesmanbacteria bacterium RBG_16_52_11]
MRSFWEGKKVAVTGGTGFIGSHLVEELVKQGARVTVPTSSGNTGNLGRVINQVRIVRADLTDHKSARRVFRGLDIVLHLAAKVAGILYNSTHGAEMFRTNAALNQTVIDAAAASGIKRMLVTSSACVYARYTPQPMREESGMVDEPEPTNGGYGWSKRFAEVTAGLYAGQFGLEVAIARPFNAYGPRDNFDPAMSHVIPGLITRIYSGENPLKVWGSGKQTRSFIYVDDLVRGMMDITEKYAVADPVNLGSGEEVTIARLARMLVKLSGKKTKIIFDTSKPDGQPRRLCDVMYARNKFGFVTRVTLEAGLGKMLLWYERHLSS